MAETLKTAGLPPNFPPEDPVEYDAWFRAQVEDGLRELNDPNTVLVSNDEVFRKIDERLAFWHERNNLKQAS